MALLRALPLFFLLNTLSLQAQLTDFAWAKQLGGAGATDGAVLVLDQAGNSYVAGAYPAGGITLGTIQLPGGGTENRFLAKLDPEGTVLWAKRITRVGGLQDDKNPEKVVVDAAGNVYLTGWLLSGATVDGVAVPGDADYCLAKFNADGALQWTRTLEMEDAGVQAANTMVYIDAQQRLRLVGLFKTSVGFGPGQVLTNTINTAGTDAFVATYDGDGTVMDFTELGVVDAVSAPEDYFTPELFAVDAARHIYRWSVEQSTLVKYEPDGTRLLLKQVQVSPGLHLNSLAVGPDESIRLGGSYNHLQGPITLEGGPLPSTADAINGGALVVKLDPLGELAWTYCYDEPLDDLFLRVRVDAIGNTAAMGMVSVGISQLRGMVVKVSPEGALLSENAYYPWSGVDGEPYGTLLPHTLALAHDGGNVVVMGTYKYNFFVNADVHFTINPADWRIYLIQFGTCSTEVPTITAPTTGFCPGEGLELTASAAEGHLWNTGATTPAITATDTGMYHVFAIGHAECYARSADIHVEEFTVPEPGIIAAGHLLVCDLTGVGYQWVDCGNGNAPIPGATDQAYVAQEEGTYAVMITTDDGCSALSDCVQYSTVGIAEQEGEPMITLWPNPTQDEVLVRTDAPVRSVDVFDVAGAMVLRASTACFSVASLASGVYTVRVRTAAGSGQVRLVRE